MTRTNLRLVSSASKSLVQTDRGDFGVLLGVVWNGDSEKIIFKILSRTIEAPNGILCLFLPFFHNRISKNSHEKTKHCWNLRLGRINFGPFEHIHEKFQNSRSPFDPPNLVFMRVRTTNFKLV